MLTSSHTGSFGQGAAAGAAASPLPIAPAEEVPKLSAAGTGVVSLLLAEAAGSAAAAGAATWTPVLPPVLCS